MLGTLSRRQRPLRSSGINAREDPCSPDFRIGLASISTFAVWVIAMEFANLRLGIPLPVRLLIMVAAMGIVGIGLGGRTARVRRRLTPVLMGLLSVFPWRRGGPISSLRTTRVTLH